MHFHYLVLGAGAAGLSFTALMEKKLQNTGKTIALLEAHSLPGGCSSYFERQGNIFDAGATTLSGLKSNGPIARLIQDLNLNLDLIKIDPGIISVFPDKSIHRYADNRLWLEELKKHFPDVDHGPIWEKIFRVSEQGWKLSSSFPEIPLQSWLDLRLFLKKETVVALGVLPSLLSSVEKALQLNSISNQEYKAMINELLFITAQNEAHETPMLMGAMGLTYPDDTYYVKGGMKAFAQALASQCKNIFYKNKVISIKKQGEGFVVTTNKDTYTCDHLISSLPEWNHNDLFGETSFDLGTAANCWSAFMMYFTIPVDSKRSGVYYQVHCDPIPYCGSKSFFVSLSHPEDQTRAQNRQTVTISCHTKPREWKNLSAEDYKARKKEIEEFILKIFCERFQLSLKEIQHLLTGSPKTFIRYTGRYRGLVGGIPHSIKRNPLKLFKSSSPFKNFHLIGDTQFPGQGIGAVVLGAQNLVSKMK